MIILRFNDNFVVFNFYPKAVFGDLTELKFCIDIKEKNRKFLLITLTLHLKEIHKNNTILYTFTLGLDQVHS